MSGIIDDIRRLGIHIRWRENAWGEQLTNRVRPVTGPLAGTETYGVVTEALDHPGWYGALSIDPGCGIGHLEVTCGVLRPPHVWSTSGHCKGAMTAVLLDELGAGVKVVWQPAHTGRQDVWYPMAYINKLWIGGSTVDAELLAECR